MTQEAQSLLNQVKQIENKLDALDAIIKRARRSDMGLTLEEDKTIEWRKAKTEYGRWFIELRKCNQRLNKLRTLSRYDYDAVNGKRTPVYNYIR